MRWAIRSLLVGLAILGAACSGGDGEATLDEAADTTTSEVAADTAQDESVDGAPDEAEGEASAEPDGTDSEAGDQGLLIPDGAVAVIDQEIDWGPCLGGAECATVVVPVSYDEPEGDTTEIAVTRWNAGDPASRIGNLFVNPGGPGFGASFMVTGLAQFAPSELNERFDIIGIDPRGTGDSRPIDCNSNWKEDINTPVTEDDGLADDVDTYLDDFAAMAAECLEEHGEAYLASITTENAARDHEALRILLGDEPMNFMGASYGTTLGSVYATMFPDNLRSLVLDGAVLPDAGLLSPDEWPEFQLQLERLEASCNQWDDCPLSQGWIAAIDELEDTLVDGPIGPLTLGEFYNAVGLTYAAPSFMADVAFAMTLALDGDGAELSSLSNSLLTPLADTGNPAEYAGGLPAIHCADDIEWSQVASTEVLEVAEATGTSHPDLGPFFGIPCDFWPVHGDGLAPIDYQGDAPVLVIGNTGDAITQLSYAIDMAAAFGDQARLLTWDATGHVAFSYGSWCIDNLTMDYLIELTLPPAETVCPTEGLIGMEVNPDLSVGFVVPGAPADLAGFETGDTVSSIGGVPLASLDDFPGFAAGEPTTVAFERDGEQLELDVIADFPEWELWRVAD